MKRGVVHAPIPRVAQKVPSNLVLNIEQPHADRCANSVIGRCRSMKSSTPSVIAQATPAAIPASVNPVRRERYHAQPPPDPIVARRCRMKAPWPQSC